MAAIRSDESGFGHRDTPDRRGEGGDGDPGVTDDPVSEAHHGRRPDDRDLHLSTELESDVAAARAFELGKLDGDDELVRVGSSSGRDR